MLRIRRKSCTKRRSAASTVHAIPPHMVCESGSVWHDAETYPPESLMLKTLILIDQSEPLVQAWHETFRGLDGVDIVHGDFFSRPADAMVSPANSFGIMDGGLDLAIRNTLGFQVESAVQKAILADYHGELPIGSAVSIRSGHASWPWLIAAPTMRIPENIAHTLNPYHAFRAVLREVSRMQTMGHAIESLVCPGLGTGIGMVSPRRCAALMRAAYINMLRPARIPSYQDIHATHASLKIAG